MAAGTTNTAVCVGTASLDTIAVVPHMPVADQRMEASTVLTAGGGPAATAAVTMARLGIAVEFAGVIGDDEAGQIVLRQLEAEGVGTALVTSIRGVATAQSVVVVSKADATRTIAARTVIAPVELPHGFAWMHVDQTGYAALRTAGGSPSRVSLDDGNPVSDLALHLIDLYAPTVDVLRRRWPDAAHAVESAHHALAAGAGTVIATDGTRGSIGVTEDETVTCPSFEVPVVSTLGAGDVYHGALVAASIMGACLADALKIASATAAMSCRAVDGRSAIPTLSELEAYLAGAGAAMGIPTERP